MHRSALIIAGAVALGWAGSASAQTVSLTLKDGRATLTTQNASVRQILTEWERQGQVRIVGADRLAASQPLTLSLVDVPERQALDIVLRGVPGYMAIDRTAGAGSSRYDRLVLLARTTTPAPAQSASGASAPPSFTPSPAQNYVQTMDQATVSEEPVDEAEPAMPVAPVLNPYPGTVAGGAPVGVQGNTERAAAPNVLNSGSATVTAGPPETQFDYANPQRYFDRMRQMQQAGQQPGQTGTPAATYPGSTLDSPTTATPAGVPSVTGTSARPGIAPAPAPPQQIFNPYNLPPEQLQGTGTNPSSTPSSTTPVEPDRSKYANPYQPTPRPPQP